MPWAATSVVELPQGPRSVFIEPRGTRRLPAQTLLALRISKLFRFGTSGEVELLVDILNAFNDDATTRVVTTNFFATRFAEGILPVAPRQAMVGVKLSF